MIKISLNWNFKNKTKHFFIDLKIYEKFSIINSSINNPTIITFSKSVWNIVKNKEKKSSSQRVRIFNQYSDSKLTKINLLNSKLNKLQWNSWTFLEYRTESNSIELDSVYSIFRCFFEFGLIECICLGSNCKFYWIKCYVSPLLK